MPTHETKEKSNANFVGKDLSVLPDVFAKTRDISSLIEYQENSVVSKMLLMKGTGNVTLFAFDGQGLSEHSAPFDALVQGSTARARYGSTGRTTRSEAARSSSCREQTTRRARPRRDAVQDDASDDKGMNR